MPHKNRPIPSSRSISNLSTSFKTGNLLSHPSGMVTFQQQSRIIQHQRKHRNDINMLNKPPQFLERKNDSDEIESDIENVPGDFQRYKEVKLYGWANGRKKETVLTEFRVGAEFSQLDDESDVEDRYDKDMRNRLNPQKSVAKNLNSNIRIYESSKKDSPVASLEDKLHCSHLNQKDIKKPPFEQQNQDKNHQEDQIDDSVDPDFLAFLNRLQQRKRNNPQSMK